MNLFDSLIVQPIFNVLLAIYALTPGGDFGIAVIVFTALIRLLMWPLVKKQLHQTKVMRQIQPELKRIKAQSKGNRQAETQAMMELYRERGVNPFAPIGLLLVQLPIFIALYQVINIVTLERRRIAEFTYNGLESIGSIASLIASPDKFNETLLGIVNLAEKALTSNGFNLSLVLLAIIAAVLQYIQARQITPKPEEGQRLRDMLRAQANGTSVDQAEVSAVVSNKMIVILPFITLFISLYLPGALVLYFVVSSLVAVIQQHIILREDVEEMETIASAADRPTPRGVTAQKRADTAREAEVITRVVIPSNKKPSKPNNSSKKAKKHKKR